MIVDEREHKTGGASLSSLYILLLGLLLLIFVGGRIEDLHVHRSVDYGMTSMTQ